MHIDELRKKDSAALNAELHALHKEAFSLRMQHATRQLKNTHLLGQVKKKIARVKTVLTEKAGL
ncbi:MAG: 50S ribosomal protein L29 [Gammaproteobacteria bacterium]